MSELGDNAFPKITGKRKDFLINLRHLARTSGLPPILDIEGTVKLHGMHADIVFDLENLPHQSPTIQSPTLTLSAEAEAAAHALSSIPASFETPQPTPTVTFQSRNKICPPQSSQQGWPRNIAAHPDALTYLRDKILTRYHEKNPNTPLTTTSPLIIAGEWIGPKVQPDVGVSKLSHRFVILSIQLNGAWQRDAHYADIEATKANVYSVFRSGSKVVKFDTGDLSDYNPALLEMQETADAVEACCPFAAVFGVHGSRGEGVVWKPATPEAQGNARYWFKTKGPIIGPENRINLSRIQTDTDRKATIDELCARFVTPRRVEQGFEYLLEMGVQPDRGSVKTFVAWIVGDVWTEEKSEIEVLKGERKGGEAVLLRKVKWVAREAYLEQMRGCGVAIS